ncbi:hypothetical protein HYW20_04405 [Candidatus Woesearchaeota archaeon]|nr:hypothetical protein [Candidatus Woesearchaeota archaeon]
MTEERNDPFMEKVMLVLISIVGIGLLYKQLFLIKYSSSMLLNMLSLLLLLALVFLLAWWIIGKDEQVHDKDKKEHVVEHIAKSERKPLTFIEKFSYGLVGLAALLILFNQFQIFQVNGLASGNPSTGSFVSSVSSAPLKFFGSGSGGTLKLGQFEVGSKITLKPMPLASGEQPVISGYKTKVKPMPTISELSLKPSTGDAARDLLNNIIPTGTPWYGQEAGVTFDDPIAAQKRWATYRKLELDPEQEQRWSKIVNSFTCDYCCGSPQNPTIITRCGCAHSAAAQGMARWFIKNYADKFTDEEIYGEMGRWYSLWYPGPTIKRIVQEMQA